MEYELIRSKRKTLAVQVKEGRVTVRAPQRATRREIEELLRRSESWIQKHLEEYGRQSIAAAGVEKLTEEELRALAEEAKRVFSERVAYYAPLVGVSVGRITVRAQHTRWGSCSSKGDLSFNCLLMLAPVEVLDSVVVHELCHRKEMNHSPQFYGELLRVCPDYPARRKWLREHGRELMVRLP